MIILHAGEEGGLLHLWGERPEESAEEAGARARGRKSRAPVPYPYDAGVALLVQGLLTALPSRALPGGGGQPPFLWAPTVKGHPVPSSGLIGTIPPSDSPVELLPYTITALPLTANLSLDLLCACVGRDRLGEGLLIGPTLAFWTTSLRYAGTLAVREQLVPGVEKTASGLRACWRPVLAGTEAQRLTALARTMPAACRALGRDPEAPPERSPIAILTGFLERTTDLLVRTALADPNPNSGKVQAAVTRFPSLHDQWVHALRSPDGTLTGPPEQLAAFAEEVRAWHRPITVSARTAFQLCFRLEEPPERPGDDGRPTVRGGWRVRYLLQDRDDPSLLLDVADVWEPRGRIAALFQSKGFAPREYLLTALGQAAGLCPPVEQSLKSKAPAGFTVDSMGAHRFLTEWAWLLEQAGFTLMLPAWWGKKGPQAKLHVQADVVTPEAGGTFGQAAAGMSLDSLVNFDWRVALGEQPIDLAELEALARLKAPLVKVRGQWVQVSAEEVQAFIVLLQKKAEAKATLREVVQLALGGGHGPDGLPFEGVRAEGWMANFLAQLEGRQPVGELPVPEAFHGTLRPYQVRGYSWLGFLRRWGMGACLADDMGLGKTVQTLALLQRDWEQTGKPTLLICPTSVVGNWKKEADRFTPELPVMVHHGASRARGATFAKQAVKHGLVLSSYSLLFRDRETFAKVDWSGVVLDEAQNIKNPDTKQAQAARSIKSDFRIALTGTPVENHVGDLWSIYEFLNPGWLGTQADFRRNFFIPIQARQDAEAASRLKHLTGPFLLRRLKTDKTVIADLPDKVEMKVFCTLTKEQATLYAAVVKEIDSSLEGAEGIQRRGLILAALTKLKQVCNHPAHFLGDHSAIPGRSGKVARLTEMLEEVVDSGDKALVFTQFAEMGTILQKHLQEVFGREVLFLHGGVPPRQRTAMVERFQGEAHGPPIFLLSLKAGGTGLNLTGACHVFHFDRWWNPAVEDQATDRAFRIGQTKDVHVHKFVCVGTLEEKIDEMIARKQQVASKVVGVGENWLTEMDNDQLRDLWALRQEAVEDD